MTRYIVHLSLAWSIPAAAIAAFAMYAAWQHNPQGEFHSVGRVAWTAWLGLGLFWFSGVVFSGLLLTGVFRLADRIFSSPP
jgi:hypothetical protein